MNNIHAKQKMQRRREKCFSLIHPFVANRQRHPCNLEEKKSWEVEIKGRRKVSGVSRFEGEKRKTAELLRREAKKTWISHFLRREKEGKQTSLFENSITIGGGGGMGSTGGKEETKVLEFARLHIQKVPPQFSPTRANE